MPRNSAVIRAVEIKEIRTFDKLVSDINGLEGKVLIPRGTVIGARELTWLKKKLAEAKPKLASQKYRTKTKAFGDIRTATGTVLCRRGEEITEQKLAPLLKDGFTVQETFEAEQKLYFKKTEWTGGWHIDDFNPAVQVERMELVQDDGSPAKTEKSDKTPVTAGK